MPIDLAELKAWRLEHDLTHEDMARTLGYANKNSYERIENGRKPFPKAKEKLLIQMMQRSGAAVDDGMDEEPVVDNLFDEPRLGDEPPIGIIPGDDESPTTGVKRLNEYESLEVELLRLLVGHRYQYEDFVQGRPVMLTGKIPGLADLLEGLGWAGDAQLIRQLAPQLAHGYVEWGRHNRRVMAILRTLTAGGAAKEALIPTGQLIFGLLMLHGLMPSPAQLIAQMRSQEDMSGGTEPPA